MRAAVLVLSLLAALCLIGCSRNYTAKQIHVETDEVSTNVPGALVDREFFSDSGARAYLGRFFQADEFRRDRSGVVVLSYKAWQSMFHSRPEVIGSKIQVDGRQTTIVGVSEPDFAPSGAGDLYIPKS